MRQIDVVKTDGDNVLRIPVEDEKRLDVFEMKILMRLE